MEVPKSLMVKRGDNILVAWHRLLEWIQSIRIIPCGGVRIQQGPWGTRVWADSSANQWNHPWKVTASEKLATVAPGFLNKTETPTINGVTLDGVDAKGKDAPKPTVPLVGTRNGRTWLCLVVATNLKDGKILTTQDAITVAEVQSLPPGDRDGGSVDDAGIGQHPLAVLYWRDGAVTRIRQNTHHNLQHRFIAATDGRQSRHVFWAV